MKTDRGGFRPMRKEQRMPQTGDAYRSDEKLAGPVRCPSCKASYVRGRWTWRAAPDDAAEKTCPACTRIAEKMPAGYVTLRGAFTPAHRAEVLDLVHGREAHAKGEHPLQRIMAIEDGNEGLLVTTTDVHLAREIAHALHEAFKGDLQVSWNKAEQVLRATWTR